MLENLVHGIWVHVGPSLHHPVPCPQHPSPSAGGRDAPGLRLAGISTGNFQKPLQFTKFNHCSDAVRDESRTKATQLRRRCLQIASLSGFETSLQTNQKFWHPAPHPLPDLIC